MAQQNYKTTHVTSSQQFWWRFKCAGMWHCLSGEQFWRGVVPSSSKSSILRRMLVSWIHRPWRWHYDPSMGISHPKVQCPITNYLNLLQN